MRVRYANDTPECVLNKMLKNLFEAFLDYFALIC